MAQPVRAIGKRRIGSHAENHVSYECEVHAVSDAWRTGAIWRGIRQEFSKGRQLLLATGKDIRDWLLDEPVQQWLTATLFDNVASIPRWQKRQ